MAVTAVIDACCMINLVATGREVEIVRSLNIKLLDTEYTKDEPCVLWAPPDSDGHRERNRSSTDALRDAGLLFTHQLDSDSLLDAFVAIAEMIGDPDASCIALAGVSGIPLITDDRKECRIAKQFYPEIQILSTLDLIRRASEALSWDDHTLADVAKSLRYRGNFAPPKHDKHTPWYTKYLQY